MTSSAAVLPVAPPPLPRALPAWTYQHAEMTRLEIERILDAELADRLSRQRHPAAG